MATEDILKKIEKDLDSLKKRHDILGILVYGSLVTGEYTERSDIDICIVAPEAKDIDELINFVFANVHNRKYDIKFFELLPLRLKIEIIKNHKVIYAKSLPDLYEYFYFYRKIWKDQEKRNTLTKEELKSLL